MKLTGHEGQPAMISIVQLPSLSTGPLMTRLPPSKTSIVLLGFAVPRSRGVVSDVFTGESLVTEIGRWHTG